MVQITLTNEQAQLFRDCCDTVYLRDPDGALLAEIERSTRAACFAPMLSRTATPELRKLCAEVQSRLKALLQEWDQGRDASAPFRDLKARLKAFQEEWDRSGAVDEAKFSAFLAGLDETVLILPHV